MVEVYRVFSFVHEGKGGNPAGVVLNADTLSAKQKQCIAAQVGYSETAFVSSDPHADFNVSFYTPTEEVDFCGHATLATFSLLKEKGLLSDGYYTQQTKAGKLGIWLRGQEVTMEQTSPAFLGTVPVSEVASALRIPESYIVNTGLSVERVSTGLLDIIVPVQTGVLDDLDPDMEGISQVSRRYNAIGFHVFELASPTTGFTASCRNFAPAFGIDEESATGSANGALASYLARFSLTKPQYCFEQGRAMGETSMIRVSLSYESENISEVKVGGRAQLKDSIMVCDAMMTQSGTQQPS